MANFGLRQGNPRKSRFWADFGPPAGGPPGDPENPAPRGEILHFFAPRFWGRKMAIFPISKCSRKNGVRRPRKSGSPKFRSPGPGGRFLAPEPPGNPPKKGPKLLSFYNGAKKCIFGPRRPAPDQKSGEKKCNFLKKFFGLAVPTGRVIKYPNFCALRADFRASGGPFLALPGPPGPEPEICPVSRFSPKTSEAGCAPPERFGVRPPCLGGPRPTAGSSSRMSGLSPTICDGVEH